MQGRLSPLVMKRVQTFPVHYWKKEIYTASRIGFPQIEWTVDTPTIGNNPILNSKGVKEISQTCQDFGVKMNSITCDFFMENPFWLNCLLNTKDVKLIFKKLFAASEQLGEMILVIPIVDKATLPSEDKFYEIIEVLEEVGLRDFPIRIGFETDMRPEVIAAIIKNLPSEVYGINLDVGNSASLGLSPNHEIETYGDRIINVHLKDRSKSGPSVQFGTGNTDFDSYIRGLLEIEYKGNLILQSVRSPSNSHMTELIYSRKFVLDKLEMWAVSE